MNGNKCDDIIVASESVRSVSDLMSIMYKYGEADNPPWFRGQSSFEWDLIPSVYRYRSYSREKESGILNEFIHLAQMRHSGCPEYDKLSDWLTLMQHYGLATRLLDWTQSILIATYFSVSDSRRQILKDIQLGASLEDALKNQDESSPAALWMLFPLKLNKLMINQQKMIPIKSDLVRDLVKSAFHSNENSNDRIVAVRAEEKNIRMLMQQVSFTIHGTIVPLNCINNIHECIVKFHIPPEYKARLSAELDSIGIKTHNIFPDLSHLSEYLAYSYF